MEKMNGVCGGETVGGQPLQLFNCTYTTCGATFTRQWRLKEHETVHTGAVRNMLLNIDNIMLTVLKSTHKVPESVRVVKLLPNVHSARASAKLPAVVVVSRGNLT